MGAFSSYQEFYSQGPYSSCLVEHRLVGTTTARLLHVRQPAGDFPDPPLPEYLLYVALEGASELVFDWGCGRWRGEWHTADISVAPPDVGTDISVDRKHAFLGLALPKALVASVLAEHVPGAIGDLGPLHAGTFRDAAIARRVHQLWRYAATGAGDCRLRTDSLVFGMLSSLAQRLDTREKTPHSLDDRRFKHVADYVEACLSENMSLADLAELCGLSSMHFARQFRLRTGLSPYQYVLQQRIARAKRLLAMTAHSLVDISYECRSGASQGCNQRYTRTGYGRSNIVPALVDSTVEAPAKPSLTNRHPRKPSVPDTADTSIHIDRIAGGPRLRSTRLGLRRARVCGMHCYARPSPTLQIPIDDDHLFRTIATSATYLWTGVMSPAG